MDNELRELHDLLNLLEKHMDPDHCREADERYKGSLNYMDIDRPPVVIQSDSDGMLGLPPPWGMFRRYQYSEAFGNPAAMMQNMLLNRVVPGVILKDDNPLAIRNDHGTILVASAFGVKRHMHENNYPWVSHLDSVHDIKILLDTEAQSDIFSSGIINFAIGTLKFYNQTLDQYPLCKKAIQISLPDLQGPMDTAEQLWGSGIYFAFYDDPALLAKLLSRISCTMLSIEREFRKYSYDRLDPAFNTQHGYVIPGRIMIRDDSAIMVSPDQYKDHIKPFDEMVLKESGTGSIHFCGNGQHLIEKMLEIPYLKGLDFGEPEKMDINNIYGMSREKKVALQEKT